MAAGGVVEWRVFLPLGRLQPQQPLSSIMLGELFSAWPVEAEDGVEDRTDVYALVGSDAVGLKHRWVVTERNGVHVNSCLCELK